jgi:hypothetical protein
MVAHLWDWAFTCVKRVDKAARRSKCFSFIPVDLEGESCFDRDSVKRLGSYGDFGGNQWSGEHGEDITNIKGAG